MKAATPSTKPPVAAARVAGNPGGGSRPSSEDAPAGAGRGRASDTSSPSTSVGSSGSAALSWNSDT